MFTALSEQLAAVLKRLTGRGVLSEQDVTAALREIRRHLLEADVSFAVTQGFVERVRQQAVGAIATPTVSPGQQVVKLVHDEIARMLGASEEALASKVRAQHAAPIPASVGLQFAPVGPTVILLVGLQGSGKTTTGAKLARRLKLEQKAPGLVAADVARPAAREQLEQLGAQVGVPVFASDDVGAQHAAPLPDRGALVGLVRAAVRGAERARCRTVIVDTAGRLQIDAELMDELKALRAATSPREVLLVADGMTGQDAVRIARGFQEGVGLTGVILTKLDGDARGGAALSIYGVTGVPIKYVGVGEKLDALEPFDPVRMAGRILGQGDVVALVEKAAATVDAATAQRLERKARSRQGMDLADFLVALKQMQAMGPLKQVLGLLPGVNARALQAVRGGDARLKHVEAIVLSMTPGERADPSMLNGSRRLRIAMGAGRPVQEVNRLLEQFQHMRKLLKRT
ncbi:MAG TPA: signal recognition particle protein [Gemmatimonadales bacterium]|nr:signal recognition particle protein [Gemmatimonadales bacterium]